MAKLVRPPCKWLLFYFLQSAIIIYEKAHIRQHPCHILPMKRNEQCSCFQVGLRSPNHCNSKFKPKPTHFKPTGGCLQFQSWADLCCVARMTTVWAVCKAVAHCFAAQVQEKNLLTVLRTANNVMEFRQEQCQWNEPIVDFGNQRPSRPSFSNASITNLHGDFTRKVYQRLKTKCYRQSCFATNNSSEKLQTIL